MPLFPLFFMIGLIALKESLWLVAACSMILVLKSWSMSRYAVLPLLGLTVVFLLSMPTGQPLAPITVIDILDAKQNGDRIRYLAKSHNQQIVVAATLDEKTDRDYERIGQRCEVELEERPVLPRVNLGGFDEARWMRTEQLRGKYDVVKWGKCTETPGFGANGRRIRQQWMTRIEQLPIKQALYVEALVLGEDRLMDQMTMERFKKFGLLHAIVISGSHIAFLILTVLWFLKKLRLTRERRFEFLLLTLPLYGWLTEWSAPVTRAVCVAMVLLFCHRINRRPDPLWVVSLIGALQLAISYTSLYDVGFQLTVGLTIFLLLSRKMWEKIKRPWNWLLISLWAQIMTSLVLQLAQQTEVSLWSPLLNILLGGWIEWVILPLSFLVGTAVLIPSSDNLIRLHGQATSFLDQALAWAEKLPVPTVAVHLFSLPVLLIGTGTVLSGWWLAERRWFGHLVPLVGLLAASLYMDHQTPERITFLDVGQGDSTVIEKAGETFVIDTGGAFSLSIRPPLRPFDPGGQIVAPFLHTRGETHIEGLVVTHADHDHIGGLVGLLRKIQVDTVYMGQFDNQDPKRRALIDQIEATGTRIQFIHSRQRIRPWLEVVAPATNAEEENDRSVVLLADVAGKRVLLTGDASIDQEETWSVQKVDILKAGHHGSKTSTGEQLLQKTDPDLVIISAGRNNRYGHPHPEVLERTRDRTVMRTDQSGMITCSATGCEPMLK